jgi:hypothetical protein
MMNKFVIAFDGFIQDYRLYDTISEAKETWEKNIKNSLLYQYDCSVYEIDENKNMVRRVSYQELTK